MDLMVNPVITDFQQDVNGDIKMLKIGQKKQDAYANIIGQAETVDLENNKTATINVSTYTEPVEITPTSGKDGMKKATVTLSNIPSPGGSGTLYAWTFGNGKVVAFSFTTAPATLSDFNNEKVIYGSEDSIGKSTPSTESYTKISDTEFTADGITYTRDATKDMTVW